MQSRNKKLLAGAAVAAGIGLLFAPGLSAAWSDSAEVDGGQITAGNLDIEATQTNAQDVSPDREDSPHAIDLATWRAVPGDVVAIEQGLDIALEGDNLIAELDTDALSAAIPEAAAEYVTYEVSVFDAEGTEITEADEGGYRFVAPRDGQDAGSDLGAGQVVGAELDGV